MPNEQKLPEDRVLHFSAVGRMYCRRCGNARLQNRKCLFCLASGAYDKKPKTKSSNKIDVIISQSNQIDGESIKIPPSGKHSKKRRSYYYRTKARRIRRGIQIREVTKLLAQALHCFEKNPFGTWELYADRLPELIPLLDRMELLLPALLKEFNGTTKKSHND